MPSPPVSVEREYYPSDNNVGCCSPICSIRPGPYRMTATNVNGYQFMTDSLRLPPVAAVYSPRVSPTIAPGVHLFGSHLSALLC